MPASRPVVDRLMDLSVPEPNSGCWLWVGHCCSDGYGKFGGGKQLPGETLAHRAAYTVLVGPIPPGTEIDHACRVRSCINPAHLRPLTHAENVRLSDHKTNHRNAVKTHCKRGHPLEGLNLIVETYEGGREQRKCRICRTVAQRQRKLKKKLMLAIHGIEIKEVKAR